MANSGLVFEMYCVQIDNLQNLNRINKPISANGGILNFEFSTDKRSKIIAPTCQTVIVYPGVNQFIGR